MQDFEFSKSCFEIETIVMGIEEMDKLVKAAEDGVDLLMEESKED